MAPGGKSTDFSTANNFIIKLAARWTRVSTQLLSLLALAIPRKYTESLRAVNERCLLHGRHPRSLSRKTELRIGKRIAFGRKVASFRKARLYRLSTISASRGSLCAGLNFKTRVPRMLKTRLDRVDEVASNGMACHQRVMQLDPVRASGNRSRPLDSVF